MITKTYAVTDMVAGTYDLLASETKERLGEPDVEIILGYLAEYYEKTTHNEYNESNFLKIIRFIRLRSHMEGFEFRREDIKAVLESEEELLMEMGWQAFD